jgi:hypothetical protein
VCVCVCVCVYVCMCVVCVCVCVRVCVWYVVCSMYVCGMCVYACVYVCGMCVCVCVCVCLILQGLCSVRDSDEYCTGKLACRLHHPALTTPAMPKHREWHGSRYQQAATWRLGTIQLIMAMLCNLCNETHQQSFSIFINLPFNSLPIFILF